MKKTLCVILSAMMVFGLTACGGKDSVEEKPYSPALDTETSCYINIAGGYDNFEALEAEFDRFNEYYPNVELKYTKIDDYNNMIGTVLDGNDAPDIYVNYSWMYGRDQYASSIEHAEDLSDPALNLNLNVIRDNIILNTDDDSLPMVPVFANTYGMLVNNSLFEKEGLSVPTTYEELVEVCEAFREKGYENPMMGFSKEETTSLYTLSIYPYFCGAIADDEEMVAKFNALDPSAGECMRSSLEKIDEFMKDGCVNPLQCIPSYIVIPVSRCRSEMSVADSLFSKSVQDLPGSDPLILVNPRKFSPEGRLRLPDQFLNNHDAVSSRTL